MGETWRCPNPKCNALVPIKQEFCGGCKTAKPSADQPPPPSLPEKLLPLSKEIVLSTGDIKREYKILSVIFAAGVQKFGGKGLFASDSSYISDTKYNEMIQEVYASAVRTFQEKAIAVGADAVIHCNFDIEQIELMEQGLVKSGNALRIQVFCTGTAVQFL